MQQNRLINNYLDLCGLACPINFVKCCLALEKLSDSERHLLEELAGHYSARGPQHHYHKSGLFSKLFGKQ